MRSQTLIPLLVCRMSFDGELFQTLTPGNARSIFPNSYLLRKAPWWQIVWTNLLYYDGIFLPEG